MSADDEAESLALALRLMQEEEQYIAEQSAAVVPEGGDDEADSLALAIRLQQADDDEALGDALGVDEGGSPSQLSYETLLRLGDAVPAVSRGASVESIDKLRTITLEVARADSSLHLQEVCSICQMEWEEGDELRAMPCGHADHVACLDQWLGVNKCCPLCHHEVPTTPAAQRLSE